MAHSWLGSNFLVVTFLTTLTMASSGFAFDAGECAAALSKNSLPCRFHGFEFCTSEVISNSLRTKVFEALGQVQSRMGFEEVVTKIANQFLIGLDARHARKVKVAELGSGSGDLVLQLAKHDPSRSFLLTDLYPQVETWTKKIQQEKSFSNILFREEPISAVDIESLNLPRGDVILTVAMLHHLRPEEVEVFLKQVVRKNLNVMVVEPLSRRVRDVFVGAGAGFVSLVTNPSAWKDLRVPFILSHDGLVSALRQYTASDLQQMLNGTGYEVEEIAGLGPVKSFRIMLLKGPI